MFLKNNLRTSRSIRARIAIFASYAVMTGAGYVLALKTIYAPNLVRNKHILCCQIIKYAISTVIFLKPEYDRIK